MSLTCHRRARLEFRERLEDQRAQLVLRCDVHDRTEQCKAATLAVDGVRPRRKRDVATGTATAPLPDRESDQLQSGQRSVAEMQFRFGELADRVSFVVGSDFDSHTVATIKLGTPGGTIDARLEATAESRVRGRNAAAAHAAIGGRRETTTEVVAILRGGGPAPSPDR